MANRIKGITIEIGGDTTQLQKSLKQVDSALKSTESNLKDINKLLKLNPGNTELLKQKQEALNKEITNTKARLDVLKEAYKQLDGKETAEAKEQQQALAREIIDTENKLKSLKKEMSDFGSVAKQKIEAVGDSMKKFGDKVSGVGKDLSMKLTAPIVAVGTLGVTYNAQMEQLTTLFTTLTGSAEEAERVISNIQEDASRSPFDTESLIKANQYLISAGVNADDARQVILDLGDAIAATGGGSDELDRMAMNLQQIKNVGKASSQDIKQFANAGINIYGLLADATGKSVEQVKNMSVSYDVLVDALSKASSEGGKYYGAMEAQSETMTGSINKLKDSVKVLLGEITKAAMPIITKIIAKIQSVVNWFRSLDDSQKELILKVGAVVAAIGPALLIIGQIISVLGTLISYIGMLANPIGIAITAVVALIAIFKKLGISWDTVISKAKNLINNIVNGFKYMGTQVKTILDGFGQMFKDKFNSLLDWAMKFVEKLKNLFKFKLEMPDITTDSDTSYHYDQEYTRQYTPSMMTPSMVGASNTTNYVDSGVNVSMTVNGGNVSANELADIVIDKLNTTIRRNNNRW